MYGISKIYLSDIPLRPIVRNLDSPTHQYSNLGQDKYFVRNSWYFHNFTKNQYISKKFYLVSFDVTYLFVNLKVLNFKIYSTWSKKIG